MQHVRENANAKTGRHNLLHRLPPLFVFIHHDGVTVQTEGLLEPQHGNEQAHVEALCPTQVMYNALH